MISAYPQFFYYYLHHAVATTPFGQDGPPPEEIAEGRERDLITPEPSHDYRLPGHFSFAQLCQHMPTDGAWGYDLMLTLVSLLWNITITVAMQTLWVKSGFVTTVQSQIWICGLWNVVHQL